MWQAIAIPIAHLGLVKNDKHLVATEKDVHAKPHVDLVSGRAIKLFLFTGQTTMYPVTWCSEETYRIPVRHDRLYFCSKAIDCVVICFRIRIGLGVH